MNSVFIVWHTHETETSVDEKLIGVYATRREAEDAVDRLNVKPGFQDSPEGFDISEYTIGKDHWTEGYVSQAEAMHSHED